MVSSREFPEFGLPEEYYEGRCPFATEGEIDSRELGVIVRSKRVPYEKRTNGQASRQLGFCILASNKSMGVPEGYQKRCPKNSRRFRCWLSGGKMRPVYIHAGVVRKENIHK
ncbi:hypothetical protein CMI48_02350 [Candidatus Pacearchaeota archaeon]|nr:hypothetical protein [Candidatus Pacearchaeota archaeon]